MSGPSGLYRKISEAQADLIAERYLAGESLRQIAISSPIGRTAIGRLLTLKGVAKVGPGNARRHRQHSLDQRFFETIDTEEKAYWLGFICADGHVSDDGLIVGLASVDEPHLRKLRQSICSDAPITRPAKAAVLNVWSKAMVEDLRSHGLQRQKSLTLQMPNIPQPLRRHFIRGLFDGDGSIKITTRRKPRYVNAVTEYTVMFCGTSDVMRAVRESVSSQARVSRPSIQIRQNLSVVEWSGRQQVLRILDWLYADTSVALDRKMARWQSIPRST